MDNPTAYIEVGVALRQNGQFMEADAVFSYALDRCQNRGRLLIEFAWSAHYRRDWAEALQRWATVESEYPNRADGVTGIGRVLLEMGRLEDAEDHLARSCRAFPSDPYLATTAAMTATKRQDWPTALQRWNVACDLDGNIDRDFEQRGIARQHMNETLGQPAEIEQIHDPETRDLVLGFESIGENCEFGLMQRRFEAEPLSLLRWASVNPVRLIRLLESKFEGIGEPGRTILTRSSWGEYFLRDKEYGGGFHTWINDCGPDEGAFLRKQEKRLSWLRDKLVADLQSGSKGLVYKVRHRASDEEISRIFALLQDYGPNRMLCVRVADKPRKAERLDVGLTQAFISRHGDENPAGKWNIAYDEWLSVLRDFNVIGRATRSCRPK